MPVIEILDQNDKSTTLKVLATYFDKERPYDLTGEYFSEKTWFGDELLTEKFAVYDHGLTELQNEFADYAPPNPILGVMKFLEKNDRGRYFKLEIEKAHEYHDLVMELHRLGMLGASSRTLPGAKMKTVEPDGHITRWPEVEISLTGTPAEARTAYSPEDLAAIKSVIKSHLLPRLEKKAVIPEEVMPVPEIEAAPPASAELPTSEQVQLLLDSVPTDEPAVDLPEIKVDPLVGEVEALKQQNAEQAALLTQQGELIAEMQKSLKALTDRLGDTEKSVIKTTEFVAKQMTDLKKSAASDGNQIRGILGLPPVERVYDPPPAPAERKMYQSAFGPSAPGSN